MTNIAPLVLYLTNDEPITVIKDIVIEDMNFLYSIHGLFHAVILFDEPVNLGSHGLVIDG